MKVSRVDDGEATVIAIEGVLDALTVPEIRPLLDTLVEEKRKSISMDLRSLRIIDSSGVGAIVSLYKRSKQYGGAVQVTGLSSQPLAIFRLLRLDRVFKL